MKNKKTAHILLLTQEEYLDVLSCVSHNLAQIRSSKAKRLPGAYHRLNRLMDKLDAPVTVPTDYLHVKLE